MRGCPWRKPAGDVTLTAVASVGGGLVHAASLVKVSSIDPYASCSITGQPGTNYPDAEVEPWVAVNPHNTSNIIGVWQQDRWSNGGARGLVAGVSTDGGSSWTQVPLPFSQCANGLDFQRASDPWVSFGPDGTAYAVSISFNGIDNKNAVGAATSTDGGLTWDHLQTIVSYTTNGGQFFTDKESVTVDPVKAGTAYTVWDTLVAPTDHPDDNPHANAFTGDAYFSTTTNSGKTWTLPHIISKLGTVFVTDPNTGQAIRTGDIIPEPAIDPATGQLYVVWQDARFNGGHFDEVALSTSTNGGANWSDPKQVNTNTPSNRPGFTPAIYVNSAGVVGVTYYDFRSLTTETATLPTGSVTPTTSGGLSLGSETHITGPFDMLTAPFASGFFVGDYEGLTAVGTTFRPFFVQTNPPPPPGNTSNPTDVFTTSIP